MRVADWIQDTTGRLHEAGIDEARLEAEVLLAHAWGRSRTQVLAALPDPMPELSNLSNLVGRRLLREPLAYILGYREFFGRRFHVTPAVLVPRAETETVVEAARDWLKPKASPRVLDLGTGSGCIAVTIGAEAPHATVLASDLMDNALEIARKNAETHAVAIEFRQGDAFAPWVGEKFDLIVTNPPYVAQDWTTPELAHEPSAALYADDLGYAFYQRLADGASAHLCPGGALILELGDGMATETQARFESAGWRVIELRADLNGTPRALVTVQ